MSGRERGKGGYGVSKWGGERERGVAGYGVSMWEVVMG